MDEVFVKKKLFGKEAGFILFDVEKAIAEHIVEGAYEEGLALSKIFNFYDPHSELSGLNSKRGIEASRDLLKVLKRSIEMSKLTKGGYDASLGKLFLARKSGLKEPRLNCSFKDILIEKSKVRLANSEAKVDLGSIAKGYIGDRLASYIKKHGVISAVIDARGDLVLFGNTKRIVGIQHPRDKDKMIAFIKAKCIAIATSGDYSQYIQSFERSHIINKKDAISVTVIAKDLMTADALATALFVVDKRRREKILKQNPKIKALVIDKNLNLHYYNGFKNMVVGADS